jgi:Family of unknown function (DUF5677)
LPTKPLESVLYREMSKVEAKNIIDVASPLLQELVNYGTNAYVRCATSASGKENEDVAAIILYLQIVEMTDGIEALVSQSCPAPAIPLVRSSFEALLFLDYILELDYVRRSLSWLVGYVHNRLDSYALLDTSTIRGQSFQQDLAADDWADPTIITGIGETEVQEAIANLESLLAQPQLQSVEEEFQRYFHKYSRRPNWYQLFGGPQNLRELARHLNRHSQYDFLYRYWSRISHANDLSRFTSAVLRDPSQNKSVASFAAGFMLNSTRLILGKFRPGEDIAEWYKAEIRERYFCITRTIETK